MIDKDKIEIVAKNYFKEDCDVNMLKRLAEDFYISGFKRGVEKARSAKAETATVDEWWKNYIRSQKSLNDVSGETVTNSHVLVTNDVLIRCKNCVHSTEWYGQKRRCFLWHEDGIDVWEDGYCNYADRRQIGVNDMTLDEAIIHCEEIAEEQDMKAGFDTDNQTYIMSEMERKRCRECASEHRQLAEWLKELREYKQQNVPDIHVGKSDFKPGDKFILELGKERKMFGEFEIKGTGLYVKTDLLEKLTRYEPEEKQEAKSEIICDPDCEGFVCHKNGIYGWCPKAERWGCEFFYELERRNDERMGNS